MRWYVWRFDGCHWLCWNGDSWDRYVPDDDCAYENIDEAHAFLAKTRRKMKLPEGWTGITRGSCPRWLPTKRK